MSPRRLIVLLCALAATLVVAGPAAAQPNPADYPETVTTARFRVHFTGTLGDTARVTYQQAADVAALAERAYDTLVTGWGYPAPLDDGDGLIDIWIQDLSADEVLGFATKEPAGNPTSGWIALDATHGRTMETVAHELFHLIQFGIWTPAGNWWLLEGSAEWAAYAVDGFARPNLHATYAKPDLSLDCTGDACGDDAYEIGGYSRWTFFHYLSERYGKTFVRDMLQRGAAAGNLLANGTALLANELAARGTTLGDVYNDYATVHMAAAYAEPALRNVVPAHQAELATPAQSGPLAVRHVAVNHLATRYVRLVRGGAANALCYTATLTLTVSLPAGVPSRPAFWSPAHGANPLPLSVSGSTASISVPWNTCVGSPPGYLSLPNASLAADARTFTVSGSVSVDTSSVTTASAPPGLLYAGPTELAPTGAVAPAIHVYGAQVLRVSSSTRAVRVIVFASGEGRLQASLGGRAIATVALRGGNNDVRFKLPATAVAQLRRAASATRGSSLLTLTSVSATGSPGATVTRTVRVVKAAKR